MHYVIIGASAAGISAAESLRLLDPLAEITLISKEKSIAYSRCLTTYYLSDKIPREKLFIRTLDQLNELKAQIISGVAVTGVDADKRTVSLSDGSSVAYAKLLVASGASPVIPEIEDFSGSGVHCLRTLQDAENIAAEMPGVKSAVVLGDGLVSITTAMALNQKGIKTIIVGIAPHILAAFLDKTASNILENIIENQGIELYLGQTIKRINRDSSTRITGVTLMDQSRLDAQMLVIAAGVKPNLEFLNNTGIKQNRGLPVNEFMETSVQDVFAAGDAAETYDIVRNTHTWNPLWPNAVEQGRAAAYNMAGLSKNYQGCTSMNSLNVYGLPVIAAGISNDDISYYETFTVELNDSQYEKLVFNNDSLIGFILLGNTEKAGVLTSLLGQAVLSPTQKEKIRKGKYSYSSVRNLLP